MLKLAVVGKDVSCSDSPSIHAFILGEWGERCAYEKVSLSPAQFPSRAEALFTEFDAFNVTIPFKAEIIPYLKELKGDARAFGAVNTVVSRTRAGYNTDGEGFMMMLENEGLAPKGADVLVLGAGGAGRSCIRKLSESGANVSAYDCDGERLAAFYGTFRGFTPLTEIPLSRYDLIVNCTGVGMHDTVGRTPDVVLEGGRTEPVGGQLLGLCGAAVDLIYVPRESEFLRIARTLGKKTVFGGAMLFYQAYYADCIYTERTPCAREARELWYKYSEENR